MDWSATQYSKFEAERTRPVRDLLARVPTATAARAVDLGCGPGNSTEVLREHFPDAAIEGIDTSIEMIEAARRRLPGLRFEVADLVSWSCPHGSDARSSDAGPYDVILANAVLQWVPHHETLVPALLAKLALGGSLAVQIPDNLKEPAHVCMREIAAEGAWAGKLTGASAMNAHRHSAEWYYERLRQQGARLDTWRTTYYHPLSTGAAGVVEMLKGTGLRPFLQRLDADEQAEFLARYREAMERAYPALPDGTVLLPFPRLFFVATR